MKVDGQTIPRPEAARSRGILLAIIAAGLLVRLVLMVSRANQPANDPDNYLPLARAVAEGRGLSWKGKPTAYRPPLYPLLLAAVGAGTRSNAVPIVFAVHLALAAGTAAGTAVAAKRWGLTGPRVVLAVAIVSFDPVLAVQSASVMTEPLAGFLVAMSLAALANPRLRRAAFFGGAWFGLAGLCRPSLLAAAPLAAGALLFRGPSGLRERLVACVLLMFGTLVPLLPWAVRNAMTFGEPVWTTTHGGYTLALANNPAYYDDVLHASSDAVWQGPNQRAWFARVNRQYAGWSEPRADRALAKEGLRMLTERPRDFLRATVGRLARFWGLAPSGAVYPGWLRLLTAAWTLPVWIILALGLVRPENWRWPRVAAIAYLAGLTAVHAVYWTDLRMRAPIVPAVALVAASAAVAMTRKPGRSCPEVSPS